MPLLINHASQDERVFNHPGILQLKVESYIAVPLYRRAGVYFGTLCVLDTLPANLSESDFAAFELMAQLITFELEAEDARLAREAEMEALMDIISIAAHDLRQPLTAVQLRAQIALRQANREKISPELSSKLEGLVGDIKRTIQLTDKLLYVGAIKAGTFQLEISELNLQTLVEQAIEDTKTNSPGYTFQLEVVPPFQPFLLQGDAVRLGQAIRNILENAVKYSTSTQAAIEVKLFRQINESGEAEAFVQIRDYGMGVAAEDLPRLFEHQYRTQQALDCGIKGTGFGLFISQKIIKANKGKLWAELPDGTGLIMNFTLPMILSSDNLLI